MLRWRSRDQSKGFNVSSQVALGMVFSLFKMWIAFLSQQKSGGNLEYDIYVCTLILCIWLSIFIPSAFDSVFFRETCQAEKGVLEQKLEDSKKEVPLQHCMSDC